MGSLQFDCPLCCNETFTSQQSLKYHLLSIIDNLLCTICSSRFETILDLAKHLDEECGKTGEEAANLNSFEDIHIKIEAEDSNDEISNSILAKALLASPKNSSLLVRSNDSNESNKDNEDVSNETTDMDAENLTEENEEVGDEIDEEVYSCSSCGVSFTSIVEHIQEYHAGQEVVIEVRYFILKLYFKFSVIKYHGENNGKVLQWCYFKFLFRITCFSVKASMIFKNVTKDTEYYRFIKFYVISRRLKMKITKKTS